MPEPLLGTTLHLSETLMRGRGYGTGATNTPDVPFREIFSRAWQEVNALQKEAEQKSIEVALGEAESFHEVIIATEKATLALQLLVQFQNKLLDAYHEIMRLQV
ncbi:MAG: flagellar hook-basal body complex protein FliE [Bacillota bacterium]|nr:flagellar hook-basal body complex protein FliE [Bacillota bacterium]